MPRGPLQAGDPEYVGRYRMLGRLGEGGMGRVVARNEYLAGTARSISVLDSVLPDYTIQRPTPEAMAGFAQVITEFTMARASFLEGQQVVAASDPLTDEAYSTGVDRFADGTRNLALAGTVTEGSRPCHRSTAAAGLADPACDE